MSSEPLISVVVPTYKRPVLVRRAIDSVRQQTYENIEILVVDDGPDDQTAAAVTSVPDPRVTLIRHPANRGLPAARNTGIRAARGAFIAFLDDDDEWRPDKLQRQLGAMRRYDAVLCAAFSDGKVLRYHARESITLDDLRRGSFDPSALLARSDVLRNVWFDETLRQGEDWDAFIRIAQRYTIGWLPEPLLLYNTGSHDRMTNQPRSLSGPEFEARTAVLRKHRDFLGERWFRYHLARSVMGYVSTRSDKLTCLWQAIRRCGLRQVVAVIRDKLAERVRWRWQRMKVGHDRVSQGQ